MPSGRRTIFPRSESYEERNPDALLEIADNITTIGNMAFRNAVDDAWHRARENVAGTPSRSGLYSHTGGFYRAIKKGPYKQWAPGKVGQQRIFSNHPGARVQELGAVIRAVHKPFLVFRIWEPWDVDKPTGPWIRAKRVVVPPRPYLGPAVVETVRHWAQYVGRALASFKRKARWKS